MWLLNVIRLKIVATARHIGRYASGAVQVLVPTIYLILASGRSLPVYIGIIVVVASHILGWLITQMANHYGAGPAIPVPPKQFIISHADGEYSMAEDDIQEAILYLADLENWMRQNGKMS